MSRQSLHIGAKIKGKVHKDVNTKSNAVVTGCDSNADVQVGPSIESDVMGTLTSTEVGQIAYREDTVGAGTSRNQLAEAEQVVPQIKGKVAIFNQEFKGTEGFRVGSANDVERLKATFSRLGIQPIEKPDLKHEQIVQEIDALLNGVLSTLKLFVCIFMSHGEANDIVLAADKKFLLKETIIDPIMQNKNLKGIAKIFIVVACRGGKRHGVDFAGDVASNYREFDRVELDASVVRSANAIDYSNCIFSYSTFVDYVSLRTEKGTFFIQNLCDNIDKANGDTIIHSIFAEINNNLSKAGLQVPVFKSTMGNVRFKDLV
ncbi:caspase-6-like [Bradysia coprophila]|uniref:caspase-6-like n=1 Tax=Bradysia coprophila TaxID=38358 RepID=UPI00187D74A4|nr:caspase-6-like [Bradysia coprophila]